MPLPGTDARIVDMEGGSLTLPPGKMGELVIQGPQVMSGYWRRPDETASALRNGWLYTGDLATMDEDGYFYIVDRKKDMVIVGGYNVYPREVDEVLLEHPKIMEAVTVGISDDVRGEVLKAYVVPCPGESLNKSEIIACCRSKLASYKVPRLVEFREELPKTIKKSCAGRCVKRKSAKPAAGKTGRRARKTRPPPTRLHAGRFRPNVRRGRGPDAHSGPTGSRGLGQRGLTALWPPSARGCWPWWVLVDDGRTFTKVPALRAWPASSDLRIFRARATRAHKFHCSSGLQRPGAAGAPVHPVCRLPQRPSAY